MINIFKEVKELKKRIEKLEELGNSQVEEAKPKEKETRIFIGSVPKYQKDIILEKVSKKEVSE